MHLHYTVYSRHYTILWSSTAQVRLYANPREGIYSSSRLVHGLHGLRVRFVGIIAKLPTRKCIACWGLRCITARQMLCAEVFFLCVYRCVRCRSAPWSITKYPYPIYRLLYTYSQKFRPISPDTPSKRPLKSRESRRLSAQRPIPGTF